MAMDEFVSLAETFCQDALQNGWYGWRMMMRHLANLALL